MQHNFSMCSITSRKYTKPSRKCSRTCRKFISICRICCRRGTGDSFFPLQLEIKFAVHIDKREHCVVVIRSQTSTSVLDDINLSYKMGDVENEVQRRGNLKKW
jgi:hypothetical protein